MDCNLSSKYGQKPFDTTTDPLETSSKTAMQKKTEAIGDLVGNNNAEKKLLCQFEKIKRNLKDQWRCLRKCLRYHKHESKTYPSKLRTIEWVVVDDFSKTDKQIEFYTFILKSSICDYSGYYALGKGNLTVTEARAGALSNTQVTFKECTQFTNCIG